MSGLNDAFKLNAYEIALIRNYRRLNVEGRENFLALAEVYAAAFPLVAIPSLWLVPN